MHGCGIGTMGDVSLHAYPAHACAAHAAGGPAGGSPGSTDSPTLWFHIELNGSRDTLKPSGQPHASPMPKPGTMHGFGRKPGTS